MTDNNLIKSGSVHRKSIMTSEDLIIYRMSHMQQCYDASVVLYVCFGAQHHLYSFYCTGKTM